MNNELNKYEASRGPLIFTMPARPFLVALNVDWLEETDWEKNRGRGVETKARELQEVTKEVVGIHVLPRRWLFAGGILRRLLRRVSVAKPISVPLRF